MGLRTPAFIWDPAFNRSFTVGGKFAVVSHGIWNNLQRKIVVTSRNAVNHCTCKMLWVNVHFSVLYYLRRTRQCHSVIAGCP